jgi:hypothetical protein
MNWVAVILGIVIVILLYTLFKYFTVSSTTLTPTANLMTSPPNITNIASPTSTRYAYGVWIYVNSWNTQSKKYIFSRAGNIALYLDGNSPILRCDVAMQGNPSTLSVLITDNFPIQKWTQVIVSLDNQYIDCYLDGKLVVSQQLINGGNMPKTPPDSQSASGSAGTPIILGDAGNPSRLAGSLPTGLDISIMDFTRWTAPVDPQSAWTSYMSKSGVSTNVFSSTGINLNILKNGALQNTFKLY